jgi:hypothetical protein
VNCNALPCEGGLSKTIGGGGNLKENHSFMNIQGSYAEVGAKVIKGDRYDYSYSLSPENLDQAEATHSLNVENISMPSPRPKIPGAMKQAPILRPGMAVLMVIQTQHTQMAVVS